VRRIGRNLPRVARDLKLGEIQEADVVDSRTMGGVSRGWRVRRCFIDGALPGERVRFRVFKRRRHLGRGGAGRGASPHRRTASFQMRAFRDLAGAAHCSICHRPAQLAAKQRSCSTTSNASGG